MIDDLVGALRHLKRRALRAALLALAPFRRPRRLRLALLLLGLALVLSDGIT
jgi:hypothetical protein